MDTFRSVLIDVLDEMADAIKGGVPGYHSEYLDRKLAKLRVVQHGGEICPTCETRGLIDGSPCIDCKGMGYTNP